MDDIIVDKRSRKMFASFLNAQSESTDVRMRTAISWDPCDSGDEIESGITKKQKKKTSRFIINIMLMRESFAFKIFYLAEQYLILIINCLKKYAKQIF